MLVCNTFTTSYLILLLQFNWLFCFHQRWCSTKGREKCAIYTTWLCQWHPPMLVTLPSAGSQRKGWSRWDAWTQWNPWTQWSGWSPRKTGREGWHWTTWITRYVTWLMQRAEMNMNSLTDIAASYYIRSSLEGESGQCSSGGSFQYHMTAFLLIAWSCESPTPTLDIRCASASPYLCPWVKWWKGRPSTIVHTWNTRLAATNSWLSLSKKIQWTVNKNKEGMGGLVNDLHFTYRYKDTTVAKWLTSQLCCYAFFVCMRNQLHHGSGPIYSGPAIPS